MVVGGMALAVQFYIEPTQDNKAQAKSIVFHNKSDTS
jgi:hypothetical protein